MINIVDKTKCTGCGACLNSCPVNAISMAEDEDGFIYPSVNLSLCINCGKCNQVCVMENDSLKTPLENKNYIREYYAGQLYDKKKLMAVSSGGAFLAFAEVILKQGGVVYGVEQTEVDYVQHVRVTSLSDAKRIRRSKYLQSDVGNSYKLVKKDLSEGKIVLFSGTGCQVAALNTFLGREYDTWYTCDVVCHGVPSHLVWRKFRNETETERDSKIVDIIFRDKSAGWSKNQYSIQYSDGSIEKTRSTNHIFHAGYLQGLFYRPSCGTCRFAQYPRVSDITLADFWKYRGKFHGRNNDVGVSLIVINNNKGKKLLNLSSDILDLEKTTSELAMSSCKHLDENPTENVNRTSFLREMKEHGYYSAANRYIEFEQDNISFVNRVKNKLKAMVIKDGIK